MLHEMDDFYFYLNRNHPFRDSQHTFFECEGYEYKWIFIPFGTSYLDKQIRHKEGNHYWKHREDGNFVIYARPLKQPRNKKEVVAFAAFNTSGYCPSVWVHPKHRRKGLCLNLHSLGAETFDGLIEIDDMRSDEYEAFLQHYSKKYPAFVIPSEISNVPFLLGTTPGVPFNYEWRLTSIDIDLVEEGELDPRTGEYQGEKQSANASAPH